MKKILILTILAIGSGVILSGCLGRDSREESQKPTQTLAPQPVVVEDQELQAVPTLSPDDDLTTIKKDLNDTKVLEEDFSDL